MAVRPRSRNMSFKTLDSKLSSMNLGSTNNTGTSVMYNLSGGRGRVTAYNFHSIKWERNSSTNTLQNVFVLFSTNMAVKPRWERVHFHKLDDKQVIGYINWRHGKQIPVPPVVFRMLHDEVCGN